MYTAQMGVEPWTWHILDPDGDPIATVGSAEEADALLSHLNRNNTAK